MTPETTELITTTIRGLVNAMGVQAEVRAEDTLTKGWVFNIIPDRDTYMLIGHQGANLHALELLLQAILARATKGRFLKFTLDVDDYRLEREWYIKETVHAAVRQLKSTGRAQALIPMPNHERKFVHALVQEQYPEVLSNSSGFEPQRRVVIRSKQ